MAGAFWSKSDGRWLAALVATFAVILIVNPLGFIGGGWDDWQYLTIARCWVEHGPCLPHNHWEGRWPVFAPIAGIFSLLGESRTALGIWPLMSSVAAIALLVVVGNAFVGRPAGWLAGLLLLVTPAFSIQLLDPSVEAIELAFVIGGILCTFRWIENRSHFTAFLAGLSFAMAFQVRETAIIAAFLATTFIVRRRPSVMDMAAALLGFALPLGIELLIYGFTTGDPLFRRHLSLAHTQIPSAELLAPVGAGHSPLLNTAYIANWRHEPGVHVHWLIDGFVNLFINGKAGLSLAATPLLLLMAGKELPSRDRLLSLRIYCLAMLYAAILIYVLAVDPKARMMFVPLAATSLSFAFLVIRMWEMQRRLLPAVLVTLHLILGLTILFGHQRTGPIEKPAGQFIAGLPGKIEIEENTRRHLALVPGAAALPGLDSEREYLLFISFVSCKHWLALADAPKNSMTVQAEIPISKIGVFAPGAGGSLCLFHYEKVLTGSAVRSMVRRSKPDPRTLLKRGFNVWVDSGDVGRKQR